MYSVGRNPVAVSSEVWVCGSLLARVAGSKPRRGHRCLSLATVVCGQAEHLCDEPFVRLQKSHQMWLCLNECGVETSGMSVPRAPTGAVEPWKKKVHVPDFLRFQKQSTIQRTVFHLEISSRFTVTAKIFDCNKNYIGAGFCLINQQ